MSTTGLNGTEDADMAELAADDGEKVVTMMDVLQEQQDFEDDANAVLGASDDKDCTYSKGYIKRQALYACLTCCTEAKTDPLKRAGVCLACSLNCHENHELVELYTKRNFRCDCGNPKFTTQPCQYTINKTELNEDNNYNQNFSGLYCTCHRPYPDPEASEEDEMIQCIICEDWLHASHLEATVPAQDQYSEMICKGCMEKNDFLHDYSNFAVNVETVDVDIVTVNGLDGNETEKVVNGSNEEDKILNDKTVEDITTISSEKETKIVNDIEMTEEHSKETEPSQSLEEKKEEESVQSDILKEEKKESESEIVPMEADNTEKEVPETENKVTEGGDVVTSKEEEEKVESAEESTNLPKKADETISTDTVATKTAEEIAELEMEKALLEEDEPSGNSEKKIDDEPVKTESEKDEKEDTNIEKDTEFKATENVIDSDNQTSETISQNNESEKVDDKVMDVTEKCSSNNLTMEPSTEEKMDEDVSEDQTKAAPSEEQSKDIATTSLENTNNTDTDKVGDQPCQKSTEDSEKQVTVEETTVTEESLVPSEDTAKETPEKTDNISKSTDDNEIDEIKSISTSVTSPKPNEQSHEKLITDNGDSPVVSETKPNLETETEPKKEKITDDTVKDQNEKESSNIVTESATDMETIIPNENKADLETIDTTSKSTGDETNADEVKESVVASAIKTDESDVLKAEYDNKPAEEESSDKKKDESPVNTETKSTDIDMDGAKTTTVATDYVNKDLVDQLESTNQNKEIDNQSESTNENKRKMSTEEVTDDISVKKAKLDEIKKCVRPSGVKKVHKGATFWPSNFRQKLCTCNECLSMYKDLSVLFLIDPEDTVSAYEMLGQEKINGGPTTQYERGLEALSSLDRIQQINALTEYNKMRDKLLDFLKSFKDRKEIVKEEDIKAFFAGMKPKREPDGVYFCR